MSIAKVFRSGNSQAVRLPKAFRVESKELEIFRRGDEIVLRERAANLERAFLALGSLPDDVFADELRVTCWIPTYAFTSGGNSHRRC
jgi:antitoxin VapB